MAIWWEILLFRYQMEQDLHLHTNIGRMAIVQFLCVEMVQLIKAK